MGLSGRAFLPMVLGFGCSVPAIMASRVLESRRDRFKVMLITPFMSCSARLPIYILFSQLFFGKNAMAAAYSMYLIGIVVALLVAGTFCVGMANYYYNMMLDGLRTRATHASNYFTSNTMSSYGEFYRNAYTFAAEFSERDLMELQFIGSTGEIIVSSYGLTAGMEPRTQDIYDVFQNKDISPFRGVDPNTGEHIMSVSVPLLLDDQVVGAMRYVTSMAAVQREILTTVGMAAGLLLVVTGMVYVSNMVFINNVVEPVAEVTETAKRIAGGSYGTQMENHYRDEIGQLNGYGYHDDPDRREDSRNLHRTPFSWDNAALRDRPGTVQQRLWDGLGQLERLRAAQPAFGPGARVTTWDTHDPHILALARRGAGAPLVCLFNFTGEPRTAWLDAMEGTFTDLITGEKGPCSRRELAPYQYCFLLGEE